MTGAFAAGWLDLREPADRRARAPGLLQALAMRIEAKGPMAAVDLGCGTGSTVRALPAALAGKVRWTLIDSDSALLAEAARRFGPRDDITCRQIDLTDLDAVPFPKGGLVTASALFDLCSGAFIDALVERVAGHDCIFYAALTHDGRVQWTPGHAGDGAIHTAFEAHLRTDKGFGPALGAEAAAALRDRLADAGMQVQEAPSDWLLTPADAALQRAYLHGYETALAADAATRPDGLDAWLAFRIEAVAARAGTCRVGHRDILAWPR